MEINGLVFHNIDLNLLITRPRGVVSKNAMGARKIRPSMLKCMSIAAATAPYVINSDESITKIAEKVHLLPQTAKKSQKEIGKQIINK